MNQDEKNLLYIDLCARLPYDVIVNISNNENNCRDIKLSYGNIGYVKTIGNGMWLTCKPYLRPLSSLTKEERDDYYRMEDNMSFSNSLYSPDRFDWYMKHHIDVRGFIEKGLAIAVTEENNPYNKL